MDIEEAFAVAGSFGRFQVIVTAISYYANILYGSQLLIMVIVGATPNADVPSEANLTTIVTEWDLYGEPWIPSLMGSLFLAGYMTGSLIFGQLPDLYGRKPIMVIGFVLATICCFCSAFCQNWHTFALTRFFGGVFAGGAIAPTFVLMCELVGKDLWAPVGMLFQIFFSLGIMLLGVLGYWLKDWRKIMMVSSGLSAIVVPFMLFIVPESPRWLYAIGKIEKAEKIMKSIATKNGKDCSVITLAKCTDGVAKDEDFKKHSLLVLFKIKPLSIQLITASSIWFACSISYYGMTFDAGDLMPNLYLAIVLSGAVEIPGYMATLFLMDSKWLGRKGTMLVLLLTSSISSSCILFTGGKSSSTAAVTSLGLISKLTIASAFSAMFIYISELFPAQLRTASMVFANINVRAAGIIASFVPLLANNAFYLPYVVFAVVTVSAGAATLVLPETLGRDPVTMSDFVNSADIAYSQEKTNEDATADEKAINADEKAKLLG